MAHCDSVIDWLLDSDPSIRWQVMRDLLDVPESEWAATRAKIETEGWGAKLLSYQDQDGQWAGGAFLPRDFDPREWQELGQPWTATTFSLSQLREFGLDPTSDRAKRTVELLGVNSDWDEGGQPYWEGEVEECINGRTVADGAYFGVDVSSIVERLVSERLDDGGWNCEKINGSVRSSFARFFVAIWCYFDLLGPERLSKIILVDQSPFLTSDPNWTQQELEDSGAGLTAQQVFDTVAAFRSKEAEQVTRKIIDGMVTQHATPEMKEWIVQCNLKMPRHLAGTLMYNHWHMDWRDLIPRINLPTLIVSGRASAAATWKSQEWVHRQIKGSQFEVFEEAEGGQHFMFIENPEKFNRIIMEYLG